MIGVDYMEWWQIAVIIFAVGLMLEDIVADICKAYIAAHHKDG